MSMNFQKEIYKLVTVQPLAKVLHKLLLMEELVIEYNMPELEAQRATIKYKVNKVLKRSPEFIMHYSVENNASEIYNEYRGIPIEM